MTDAVLGPSQLFWGEVLQGRKFCTFLLCLKQKTNINEQIVINVCNYLHNDLFCTFTMIIQFSFARFASHIPSGRKQTNICLTQTRTKIVINIRKVQKLIIFLTDFKARFKMY